MLLIYLLYYDFDSSYQLLYFRNPMNLSQFDQNFFNTFDTFGKKVSEKYQKTIQSYEKYIIPFQNKRMKQNQSLSFKNTSLQRQKLDLLKRAQEMTAEGQRHQYILEKQSQKIIDLQRTIIEMQNGNNQNLSLIEALRFNQTQLQASLNEKLEIIKQVQGDKNQVLKKLQEKNKDYDNLIVNYLHDKNTIAQKLNYVNQLEQGLMEKQKNIQQKQFYLKKKWEQLEQAKKQHQKQKQEQIPQPRYIRRVSSKSESMYEEEPEPTNQKAKHERIQILKNPVKKIIKHHNNQIYDLAFNYNGNTIATCGGDRAIKIYDVLSFRSGATIQSHSVDNIYLSLSLDYSGEKLLAGSTDRSVQVFSTSTGKQLHSFVGHGYKVNAVSWTSSKQKCVSGSEDKQIKIWEIEKASNILSISCGKPVKCLTCNTIQPVIYSGHSDGSVRLYSLTQSSSPIAQIKGIIDYPINSIVVLSNRSQVLVSSQEGSPIYLLDLKMNKVIKKYETKQFFNSSVRAELSPTEKYVVAGNCDGYIYYWNKDKQIMQKRVSGHQSSITTLKYHFLSNVLASCDKQGNVIIWQ